MWREATTPRSSHSWRSGACKGGRGHARGHWSPLPPEVSEEIRSLFGYIGRYSPHTIELEAMLQPFIPDYVPAVGDIDAFLKLPRPDGKAG